MLFTILNAPATATNTAVFDSGFLITVSLIVISTLVIAFINHMKRDKCLMSLRSDIITVYFNDGKMHKGRFDVETTGFELIWEEADKDGKRSCMFYKDEYPNIRFFARYHGDLDSRRRKERQNVIKKAYHPNLMRRTLRSINIFFKIIRDSLMEIFNAFSGKLKTVNTSYATTETYVTRVNKEAVTTIDTTYNPLLEKYIGNRVVCEHIYNGAAHEILGILKDYTGQYIELLDVKATIGEFEISHADLVVPRTSCKIRNLGEKALKPFMLSEAFDLKKYKKTVKNSRFNNIDKVK